MTFFRRLVPSPLLSCALFALWLSLSRSASAGHVLIGLALGLAVPRMTAKLRMGPARVRRPLLVLRFMLVVGFDVVMSNLQVAKGVLVSSWRMPSSRFVIIPLELRAPWGLTALAMVTTIVPGTVWSELALDRSALMLHVWDVEDEAAFIARYKDRYEVPLREIFE